ncbi:MAG: prepilin-type N-terminal cleavage/methylation domain-containing protein [Verrucomicrobiae bacterium]|nr:prepilin-type N-terminal cleavage/methylation domain-containing protein [Verrucomicrobiae bacterium]MCP5539496.1 prepilin-type N-terminal cleavage/methylation domain-containing protein [Akkermansiaceae bacterium]
MKPNQAHKPLRARRGFSLVEVLAAVAIIGIIAFLALPNIVAIKEDGEMNLAISRAEAVNMAIASYIQANGRETAITNWSGFGDDDDRYAALAPYLAFAPTDFADFVPGGFGIDIPDDLANLAKAGLTKGGTAVSY